MNKIIILIQAIIVVAIVAFGFIIHSDSQYLTYKIQSDTVVLISSSVVNDAITCDPTATSSAQSLIFTSVGVGQISLSCAQLKSVLTK